MWKYWVKNFKEILRRPLMIHPGLLRGRCECAVSTNRRGRPFGAPHSHGCPHPLMTVAATLPMVSRTSSISPPVIPVSALSETTSIVTVILAPIPVASPVVLTSVVGVDSSASPILIPSPVFPAMMIPYGLFVTIICNQRPCGGNDSR